LRRCGYWDRKGWKDAFSNEEYTTRQQKYSVLLHDYSIYTPQVIINGNKEFVGTRYQDLQFEIEQQLARTTGSLIDLTFKNVTEKGVTVSYTCSKTDDQTLYLALVQQEATTIVKGGENAGRLLQHRNIVRELKACNRSSGTNLFKFPHGISAKQCIVIGFLQNTETGTITGARALNIA
jgi:hypothetical protein